MGRVKDLLERAEYQVHKINLAQEYLASIVEKAISLCSHPIDKILTGNSVEYTDSVTPPFRVCTECGLAEQGWYCGYNRLKKNEPSDYSTDGKIKSVERDKAWKHVRVFMTQEQINRERFDGQKFKVKFEDLRKL